MTAAVGLLFVGLVALVAGGELLLRGAVGLATVLRLTPAVIGLTVVAAGTSLPELAVSAIAAAAGNPDIAVGNVFGSSIFNVAFLIGIVALVRPPTIAGNTIRLEYPVLALVTLMVLAIAQDGAINRLDAALCLAVYACFTAFLVTLVREQLSAREITELRGEVAELTQAEQGALRARSALALAAAGAAVLWLGARATVGGAVSLAELLGLSDRIIGLTVVSIGTGLPEVVTCIVSSLRGRNDVAIGNVIGSNLFNLLGILGVSALVAPLPVARELIASDGWWLLGVTLLALPLLINGARVNRWEGGLLLVAYAAYLYGLVGSMAPPGPG